jgi:IMP dehydrogenase
MITQRGITFDDVVLVPNYCDIPSRSEVDTSAHLGPYRFPVPIISANMDTITGPQMALAMHAEGGLGIIHRFMSVEDNVRAYQTVQRVTERVGVSVGVNEFEIHRAEALIAAGARLICVDVAHGHSKLVGKMLKTLRSLGDDLFIIAGNVCSYAGGDYLAACGADAIKVGIGPGSVCTTRVKTGCGVPQLSAILDCARVTRPIIADGGIRTPGDMVKAIAAGASMVMVGGMLAGTKETGCGTYRGSASREMHDKMHIVDMPDWKTAEGVSVSVNRSVSVRDVIRDMEGGLRSGMTYCGARSLAELKAKAQFMEVTAAGVTEGTAHFATRSTNG